MIFHHTWFIFFLQCHVKGNNPLRMQKGRFAEFRRRQKKKACESRQFNLKILQLFSIYGRCHYTAEILPIQRKTLFNHIINFSWHTYPERTNSYTYLWGWVSLLPLLFLLPWAMILLAVLVPRLSVLGWILLPLLFLLGPSLHPSSASPSRLRVLLFPASVWG